jgi:hypothetical protein
MQVWSIEILKEEKEGCLVQTSNGDTHFVTWEVLQTFNKNRAIKGWDKIEDLEECRKKFL